MMGEMKDMARAGISPGGCSKMVLGAMLDNGDLDCNDKTCCSRKVGLELNVPSSAKVCYIKQYHNRAVTMIPYVQM